MEKKKKILITMPLDYSSRFIGVNGERQLARFAEVTKNTKNAPFSETQLSQELRDVDGVIVGWGDHGLSEENLRQAEKLKVIGVIGASVKKVHPEIALARGIKILNTSEIIGDYVAEHTLALILSWLRRITSFDRQMKQGAFADGSWDDINVTKKWDTGSFLRGKNIGIIGLGIVGLRLVELLKPFNVTVRAYSSHFPPSEAKHYNIHLTTLEEVLRTSEVVTIHAGLRKETQNLLARKELEMMKEGALLVNTARAAIVNEADLIAVLREGRIYAALDVFEREPLPADSPLRRLENVILTPHAAGPHLGGYEQDVHEAVGRSLIEKIQQFFFGENPPETLSDARIKTMT